MVAPKPKGLATTRAGKEKIVARTRALLANSTALVAVPISGVTMEQIDMLRRELPPETVAAVVKNSLLSLSVKDTEFQAIADELDGENMFFFISDDARRTTYDAFVRWQKEIKRQDPDSAMRFIALENEVFKGPRVEEISKIPSKKDLLLKIALSLQQLSTRITMDIKEVASQLGRAMSALKTKLETENASTGSPPVPTAQG